MTCGTGVESVTQYPKKLPDQQSCDFAPPFREHCAPCGGASTYNPGDCFRICHQNTAYLVNVTEETNANPADYTRNPENSPFQIETWCEHDKRIWTTITNKFNELKQYIDQQISSLAQQINSLTQIVNGIDSDIPPDGVTIKVVNGKLEAQIPATPSLSPLPAAYAENPRITSVVAVNTQLPLDSPNTNGLNGATISGGIITLPPGCYDIDSSANFTSPADATLAPNAESSIRVYEVGSGNTVLKHFASGESLDEQGEFIIPAKSRLKCWASGVQLAAEVDKADVPFHLGHFDISISSVDGLGN